MVKLTQRRTAQSSDGLGGRRVLVVGLGIEGIALTRYFGSRGYQVTVTDARPADALEGPLTALADVPFTHALGGSDPDLAAAVDVLYVSQGVPLSLPLVGAARARRVPVRSIATLLFDICAGRIIGITGSAGKTTTTALTAAIVQASGRPHVLCGNIGAWPLDELQRATPETLVVAEISHTQLQLLERSPAVACVTNVTPNHLDQFSWEEYVDFKRRLVRQQTPQDIAVLNLDNPVTRSFRRDTRAETLFTSMSGDTPGDGTFVRDGWVTWRRNGIEQPVLAAAEVPLRGAHNLENVLSATAIAGACAIAMPTVAEAVRAFRAVPHRLEVVAHHGGVTWVNDSIATAPERTLAGMRSFAEPLVLLLGGRDKNLPLAELAAECVRRCRAVIGFGEAGPAFAEAVRQAVQDRDGRATDATTSTVAGGPTVTAVQTLAEAVTAAAAMTHAGDVVLFAPAGTSFDAYPNFERRGEAFRALVMQHAAQGTDTIAGVA